MQKWKLEKCKKDPKKYFSPRTVDCNYEECLPVKYGDQSETKSFKSGKGIGIHRTKTTDPIRLKIASFSCKDLDLYLKTTKDQGR